MEIKEFHTEDTEEVVALFYDTVHSINTEDYSPIAVDAWAPEEDREEKEKLWRETLEKNMSYIARIDGEIVGFADLTENGYLDRVYVHRSFQGQGIATALLEKLEEKALKEDLSYIHADVSITAKPFFEAQDYSLISEKIVEKKGVSLVNYRMMKNIGTTIK